MPTREFWETQKYITGKSREQDKVQHPLVLTLGWCSLGTPPSIVPEDRHSQRQAGAEQGGSRGSEGLETSANK